MPGALLTAGLCTTPQVLLTGLSGAPVSCPLLGSPNATSLACTTPASLYPGPYQVALERDNGEDSAVAAGALSLFACTFDVTSVTQLGASAGGGGVVTVRTASDAFDVATPSNNKVRGGRCTRCW